MATLIMSPKNGMVKVLIGVFSLSSVRAQDFLEQFGADTQPRSLADCGGKENGCQNLQAGDGDCDSDADCQWGLKCGWDNCGDFRDPAGWPDTGTEGFDLDDDCCFAPAEASAPAKESAPAKVNHVPDCGGVEDGCQNIQEGDGDCDSDAECQSGLTCGANNCGEFRDPAGWPDTGTAGFDLDDDCCYDPLKVSHVPVTQPQGDVPVAPTRRRSQSVQAPRPSSDLWFPPKEDRRPKSCDACGRRRSSSRACRRPTHDASPELDVHAAALIHDVKSKSNVDVLLIGDFGSTCYKGHQQARVAAGLGKVAARKNADSILALGDNIYSDGAKDSSYMVSQWRDIYMQHEGNRRPWYAVAGNHDWMSDVRVERDFTYHPDNIGGLWQMPTFWYKVTYQTNSGLTVDMFHIDSMIWRKEQSLQEREKRLHWVQKEWVTQGLASSTADWKIVVCHHHYYSAGRHGKSYRMKSLSDIMRKYGANIFISGHAHSQHLIHHNDVYYIVSGAGAFMPRKGKKGYPSGSLKVPVIQDLGFAHLNVRADAATLTFYSSDGWTKHSVVEIERPRR